MNPLSNDLAKELVQAEMGKRIRAERQRQAWSQTALAAACGLHVSHVSKIERGGANLTVASLLAITTAMRVDLFELFQDMRVTELLQHFQELQTIPNHNRSSSMAP